MNNDDIPSSTSLTRPVRLGPIFRAADIARLGSLSARH